MRQVAIVLLVVGVALFAEWAGQEEPPPTQAQAAALAQAGDVRSAWAYDLATRLGNPAPTQDTIDLIVAWQTEENTIALFNPLATSQDAPGATRFNGSNVKNYPDYETGMDATVITIRYPAYAEVLAGLQSNDPERALVGLARSPWAEEAGYGERVHKLWQTGAQPAGAKSLVTPTMEIGAHFDTVDCGAWGFQVGCQHWGTDYLGSEGTPVYAPFAMQIVSVGEYGPGPTAGQFVQGVLPDGLYLYLGHLEGRQVGEGQTVPAGALLGYTNSLAHTHAQLGRDASACAQSGTCLDFEEYWNEH